MGLAFDTPCPIEVVSAVPLADWFSDTSVPGGPEPIRDCATPDLSPIPELPVCPQFSNTVVAVTRAVPVGRENIQLQISQGPECTFTLGMIADLPIACPVFPATQTAATVALVPPNRAALKLRLVETAAVSLSACAFDFDVDANFPCTAIVQPAAAVTRQVPTGHGDIRLNFTDNGSCQISVGIEADFPVTCVALKANPPRVRMVPSGQENFRYSLSAGNPSECSYVLGAEIDFPCVRLGGTFEAVTALVVRGQQRAALTVTAHSDCSYSYGLEVDFPDACPVVTVRPVTTTIVPKGREKLDLGVVTRDSAGCDLSFVPEIAFPCFPPPVIRASSARVAPSLSGISLKFGQPAPVTDPCSFSLGVEVAFPWQNSGLVGQVTGGGGTAWGVTLYPDGPGVPATAFPATVCLPTDADPYQAAPPAGTWIGPITHFETNPCGAGDGYVYAPPAYMAPFWAETTSSGLPGFDAGTATPGEAACVLLEFNGTTLDTTPYTAVIRNGFTNKLGPYQRILCQRVNGFPFLVSESGKKRVAYVTTEIGASVDGINLGAGFAKFVKIVGSALVPYGDTFVVSNYHDKKFKVNNTITVFEDLGTWFVDDAWSCNALG